MQHYSNAPRAAARRALTLFALFLTLLFVLPQDGYGQSAGVIAGTVVEAATGDGLPGANVTLEGTGRGAATGTDGGFEIAGAEPGTYTLVASLVGFEMLTRRVTVRAGETARVVLALRLGLAELDELVVEGRSADLVGVADAASQGQVGQAQLRARPLARTGEVMETVPGLIATQHSGSGKANQFFLRGFNLDHGTDFSASVEGVPMNLPTHAHGQGYLDLNFLIPELIEGIQFSKGPYHADGGDFATAGAASIRLADQLGNAIIKVEAGADEYYRGLIANSQSAGSGTLLYAAQGRYYNGPWVQPENGALVSGVLKYSAGNAANGYSVTALGYRNEWDATDQIPRRAVENEISRFGSIDPTDGGTTNRYTLVGRYQSTNERRAQTHARVYGAYYGLNLFSNFTYFLENPERGDQFEQAERRVYGGGEVSRRWFADVLGARSANTVGAEVRHDRIFEIGLFQTDERERFGTIRDDEVAETSAGLYAETEARLADKLRTTLGLRADAFRFDVQSSIDANGGTETDAILSPKFGLTLGPWRETEYYLNLGLGYHSNDARGTTITLDPASGTPVDPVDPLVRTRGAEIGARSGLIDGLRSSLALFYVGLESELVFVGDAGGTEASRASEHYGVEWNNFYQITDWLTYDLDVALTESGFTEGAPEENEITNSIGRIINSGVSAGLSNGLRGSLRVRHFGPRPLTEDGSVESESTTLFNLKIGYGFDRFEVALDVLNLLDAEDSDIGYFFASRLEGEPAGGVADVHFHPVLPRTARLSVAYRF